MITDNGTIDIEFGGPATYCIVVKGELGQEWSDRLAGLAITSTQREGASPHTTLAGRIRDQAGSTASSTPSTACTCRFCGSSRSRK